MAEEPDNLVRVQLREIRASMAKMEAEPEAHDQRFDDLHETATYGVGLAAMANLKLDRLADRFEAVENRIAKFDAG